MIRRLAPLVILAWVAFAAAVTLGVPTLEKVGEEHSVPLAPQDSPAVKAMHQLGKNFGESDSDGFAMLVMEGQQPLDDDARQYYNTLVGKLRGDTRHVEHVQDLWGDRLTASGVQSPDSKAVYVQLSLVGDQGTTTSQDSINSVRQILHDTPAPSGVATYLTGPATLISDMQRSGDRTIIKMTAIGGAIIFVVLLFIYRSLITTGLLMLTVGIEMLAARGTVAFLGDHGVFGLSTFSVNLLVALAMAAGTDYGIFFFGRYQEARQDGEDPESAYYTTYRSVSTVVLGSGLTIAGAMLCLSFTRMPIFQTIGVPCTVGLLVSVAIALSLIPALIAVASRFGLLDPKRRIGVGRWRRIGTAIVRWPAPILVCAIAVALIGLIALPGYQTSYNDRLYIPTSVPANVGYAAADRHFSQSRLMPEILMIESDHDLRNPADFLVLHRLAKAVFRVPGVSRVQGITRPEGNPIEHTSIPFLISLQNAAQAQGMHYLENTIGDLLKSADLAAKQVELTKRLYALQVQANEISHRSVLQTKEMVPVVDQLRDQVSDFDDFFRPIRNYLYWEPHCDSIPMCASFRSVFDAIDGVDKLDDQLHGIVPNLELVDQILPQTLAPIPRLIEIGESARASILKTHATASGSFGTVDNASDNVTAMGQAFDAARNDDSFYLPPEVFANPEFQKAMNSFISPDGKSARFIISHKGDPTAPEAIARVDQIMSAAEESLKTTPLQGAKLFMAGTASTFKDLREGAKYDLLIAAIGALTMIFAIMLIITRSLIAATVVVGTVALSLGASFGLSVLIWQYFLGINLHWMVLPMSVIILLAVGSDYNLLLVSRIKEEVGAGINTGIIRAMGGTGKVVTNAGLVFALTMASMIVSDLRIIGQVGTTIGLGLLFDTLVVRSFMTPSIAALLGRWFWWPQRVRPRPASTMLRDSGPRPAVRALLGQEDHAVGVVPVSERT